MNPLLKIAASALILSGAALVSPAFAENTSETPPFYNGRILPTPRQVKYSDSSVTVGRSGDSGRATAVCVAAKQRSDAGVRELLDKFTSLGAAADVISDVKDAGRCATVILLGKQPAAEELLKKNGLAVPDKPEGYLIHTVKDGNRSVILCVGNDPAGDYRAVQSLKQLTFRDGDTVRIQAAEVSDYPVFRWRGILGVNPDVRWLFVYKFNFGAIWGPSDWRNPSEADKERIKKLIPQFRDRYLTPLVAVNPTRKPGLVISDDADVTRLLDCFKLSLEAGGGISLHLDDTSFPLAQADRDRFGEGGAAHKYLIERVYQLRKDYPDFPFFVCPPFYASDLGGYYSRYGENGKKYYESVKTVPEDVELYWTGGTVTSKGCTEKTAADWTALTGRRPVYWDNWYQYGYPMIPKDFPGLFPGLYRQIDSYIMAYGAHDYDCVGLATLADYLWNPEAYRPQESLKTALEQLAGPDVYPDYVKWIEKRDATEKLLGSLRPPLAPPRTAHDVHLVSLGGEALLTRGVYQNVFMFYRGVKREESVRWQAGARAVKTGQETTSEDRTVFDLADMDGDGTDELLIAGSGGTIDLYNLDTNSKPQVWEKKGSFCGDIPKQPVFSLCAADFDGDGKMEILLNFTGENSVRGYHGDAGRWLDDAALTAGLNTTDSTRLYLCAGDVNGDRLPDLVVGTGEGTVRFFINRGTGQQTRWQEEPGMAEGISPAPALASPAFGDADGDGTPELLVADCYGIITGYRRTPGDAVRWTKDEKLSPAGAGGPAPPVESLLKELETLSEGILSRSRNPVIGRQIDGATRRERKWVDDYILLKKGKK